MQNKDNKVNMNNTKQLPEVFNELKEIRRRQAMQSKMQPVIKKDINKINIEKIANKVQINQHRLNEKLSETLFKINGKRKIKTKTENLNYDIYQSYSKAEIIDHRFNAVGVVLGILFFILFMTTVKSNYIFATVEEEEKRAIGAYEPNEKPIDLMGYISENISEITKKEVVTEEKISKCEIEYIENDQLPKNEQIVVNEGIDEKREITYVRSYENGELTDEVIISDNLIQEASKGVVQVGTSEFLLNNKIHIGETIYTKKETYLMNEPSEISDSIGTVYRYIDVTLKEVKENWCRISVDGIEGYVKSDSLTSSVVYPEIVEKNRIKRIQLSLNFDMEINKPSGLLKEDFKKVLSGNISDIYRIFENNAEVFYEIERKYNINGLFVAAIGIHESNWGTSRISLDKKNLFGYGAYDSSPYASAVTFESYEYGIDFLAKMLTKYYINIPGTTIYDNEMAFGTYYNGSTISAVNTRYASDQNWANRVYQIMSQLYDKLDN